MVHHIQYQSKRKTKVLVYLFGEVVEEGNAMSEVMVKSLIEASPGHAATLGGGLGSIGSVVAKGELTASPPQHTILLGQHMQPSAHLHHLPHLLVAHKR